MMVLLVVLIAYPFLLRNGCLGPVQPFFKRMRFHYWLGYTIAGALVIHLMVPMSAGLAGQVDPLGLDLATVAMFLVFGQVMLGRRLSWPQLSTRRLLRRWHFWVMIGIVLFVLGHIALNSPAILTLASKL
jgi:hypothetical protein